MSTFAKEFENFGEHIWLNTASEGALPKCSVNTLAQYAQWKSLPYELTDERFVSVQVELKESIARLLHVSAQDVILANSASYGTHILANGINWHAGDEILLMENDFPSNILPFLALAKKGVIVRQVRPQGFVLTPEEAGANISSATKLLCLSHVHSFSGAQIDLCGFSSLCRERRVRFCLNISQSAGTMPLDFSDVDVDALVCAGYKWLCGPYGSGFCWIKPEFRKGIDWNHNYWPLLGSERLQRNGPLVYQPLTNSRKFDVFATANFFNFAPFKTSIDYLLKAGLKNIYDYNQKLLDIFISRIPGQFKIVSPVEKQARSNLVFFSHTKPALNKAVAAKMKEAKIHAGFWRGHIRLSPHIYNTERQIGLVIEFLKNCGEIEKE